MCSPACFSPSERLQERCWCAFLSSQRSSGGRRTNPKGLRVKVLLTHEEIGQMLGSTRETVTRLRGEFKRSASSTSMARTSLERATMRVEAMVSF